MDDPSQLVSSLEKNLDLIADEISVLRSNYTALKTENQALKLERHELRDHLKSSRKLIVNLQKSIEKRDVRLRYYHESRPHKIAQIFVNAVRPFSLKRVILFPFVCIKTILR